MSSPIYVTAAEILSTISLCFLAGVSFCLSAWVMPVILLAYTFPRVQVSQFNETISRGSRYLHTTSQVLGVVLFITALLLYFTSDPRWRNYAVMIAILAPISLFERTFVFPTNDRVAEIGVEMEKSGSDGDEKVRKELQVLFKRWQIRNLGRVGIPLFVSCVGIVTMASER